MNPEVVAFLERVSKAKLFSNVGKLPPNDEIARVHTWEEAYRACNSQSWEDFLGHRHNEMALQISHDPNDSETCDEYDAFVIEVRSRLDTILQPIVEKLPISPQQQKKVFGIARGDLLRACIEIEYKEFITSPWHLELADWFFRGHFPCGWEGDWPEDGVRNGKLVIY
jgi:hypothetical protein